MMLKLIVCRFSVVCRRPLYPAIACVVICTILSFFDCRDHCYRAFFLLRSFAIVGMLKYHSGGFENWKIRRVEQYFCKNDAKESPRNENQNPV
jgi:hypothetical protein